MERLINTADSTHSEERRGREWYVDPAICTLTLHLHPAFVVE